MKRKPMQVSIERILKAHGKLHLFQSALHAGVEFHLRLEQPGYDPLVIEVVGSHKVSIAHYFEQNGDLMADPEIVFSAGDFLWVPIELTQAPFGSYRTKFFVKDGVSYIDANFDAEVNPLVTVWARNLRHQGWENATSSTNPVESASFNQSS